MPATYDVIYTYEDARAAKRKKNYLKAARLYRMCHYSYYFGELGDVFYSQVQRYGMSAYSKYEYCKSKLTDEAQRMLEKEEEEQCGDWGDFVRFDMMKIEESDIPSPNKQKKKGWWRRWLTTNRR